MDLLVSKIQIEYHLDTDIPIQFLDLVSKAENSAAVFFR